MDNHMSGYGHYVADQMIARTRRTIEDIRKRIATMPDTAETEVLVAYVESLEACARPAFDIKPEVATPARGMFANL